MTTFEHEHGPDLELARSFLTDGTKTKDEVEMARDYLRRMRREREEDTTPQTIDGDVVGYCVDYDKHNRKYVCLDLHADGSVTWREYEEA